MMLLIVYYITKIGNRKMFIFFMNKINNDLKNIHIDEIMNLCISECNENILELLVYTYNYEPPKSIVNVLTVHILVAV